MDITVIISATIAILSLLISIVSILITNKTKKRYEKYVEVLGNGKDIAENLKKYIDQVNNLNNKDDQIIDYCNKINNELAKSITKIGLVRYDTYNNTKNKLSFALALLNRENSGIILNSIYTVDDSNIFSKPIINGNSKYQLSSEEKEAVNKAINNK